jgi:hypothetical protein
MPHFAPVDNEMKLATVATHTVAQFVRDPSSG